MAILFSREILDSIENELTNATNSVQIITAYCKESTIIFLDDLINKSIKEKKLLIRFRLDDIILGSTDFSVLETCMIRGWKVYIRFDLHAKTYVIDNKRGIIGSANATASGLNLKNNGNVEMATLVEMDYSDIEKINKLYLDSISVDQNLIDRMKKQISEKKSKSLGIYYSWDESITSLFKPKIETLFSYEFPDSNELIRGEYISFLEMTYTNINDLKLRLRWSNSYLWLLKKLKDNDGCLYFGEATKELHNSLVEDPKPYRKDVKKLLANLLSIIISLDMDEIIIDRPNYSQRIRLKNIN